jgi:chromosome segregation ATPase
MISVSKREAFKAEEDMSKLEKSKVDQDLLIDKLNEQIKVLEDSIALVSAQLLAQKEETGLATKTLVDAAKEMDSINSEKRQLLQTWKSSLIAISQKDEYLAKKENEILYAYVRSSNFSRKLREELLALDGEINNYKKAIEKEQSMNETLTGTLNKVTTENTFLEKQIQKIVERKEALVAEIEMKQKAMEGTEEEMARITQVSINDHTFCMYFLQI